MKETTMRINKKIIQRIIKYYFLNIKKWNIKTIKQYWALIFRNGKIQMQDISEKSEKLPIITPIS